MIGLTDNLFALVDSLFPCFHVASSNHVIHVGWDEAKIIDQEPDKTTRWLKELIWIRSRGNKTMNKDEGAYRLDKSLRSDNHKTATQKFG